MVLKNYALWILHYMVLPRGVQPWYKISPLSRFQIPSSFVRISRTCNLPAICHSTWSLDGSVRLTQVYSCRSIALATNKFLWFHIPRGLADWAISHSGSTEMNTMNALHLLLLSVVVGKSVYLPGVGSWYIVVSTESQLSSIVISTSSIQR